ncbi:unnamed protein product [Hermetia illucens]|uniref:Uncharacterized protein n=1 Tax=Hermetia illucens TaxID=343691 RepID=A0A7R8UR59_HERIL|nr:unnamed protein product [Hermetia illucens]
MCYQQYTTNKLVALFQTKGVKNLILLTVDKVCLTYCDYIISNSICSIPAITEIAKFKKLFMHFHSIKCWAVIRKGCYCNLEGSPATGESEECVDNKEQQTCDISLSTGASCV